MAQSKSWKAFNLAWRKLGGVTRSDKKVLATRFIGHVKRADCAVVALANVLGWSYNYTEDYLRAWRQPGRKLRDAAIAYFQMGFDRVQHASRTVREFAAEFPQGAYLVTIYGHVLAIIDGKVCEGHARNLDKSIRYVHAMAPGRSIFGLNCFNQLPGTTSGSRGSGSC